MNTHTAHLRMPDHPDGHATLTVGPHGSWDVTARPTLIGTRRGLPEKVA